MLTEESKQFSLMEWTHINFREHILHQKPDAEDSVKGQQQSEAFNARHQSHNTK